MQRSEEERAEFASAGGKGFRQRVRKVAELGPMGAWPGGMHVAKGRSQGVFHRAGGDVGAPWLHVRAGACVACRIENASNGLNVDCTIYIE